MGRRWKEARGAAEKRLTGDGGEISLRSCVFFQVSDGSNNEFDDIDCAIVSRGGRSLDADGELGTGGLDQEEADDCHDPEAEIREGCQPGSEPLEFSYLLGEGLRLL